MRVLVVTNLYPNPFEPNRATFNRQQVRALADRHPVRVLSPISWIEELAARWRGAGALPRDRRVTCDGLVVDHPRYWYPPGVLRSRYGHFYRRSIRRTFRRALAEFRPDVVFAPWAYPDGWAAVSLGHEAGLPVVIKVHGCDVLWGLRRNPQRQQRTEEGLRAADAVMAVSRDLAENVARFGVPRKNIRVVYDGVEASVFHPGPREAARARLGLPAGDLFLFVGALVPVKAIDVLLQACARLRSRGRAFRCCLVGDGPLRGQLERQAETLGVADMISFVGPRPHPQLGDWYRAASVFVLPSHSEGVPCVLLEAMACGTPFVATRVGGVAEVAHLGAGQLVPPGNPEALADALAARLTDERQPPATPARSHAIAAAELAEWLGEAAHRRAVTRNSARPAPCLPTV